MYTFSQIMAMVFLFLGLLGTAFGFLSEDEEFLRSGGTAVLVSLALWVFCACEILIGAIICDALLVIGVLVTVGRIIWLCKAK